MPQSNHPILLGTDDQFVQAATGTTGSWPPTGTRTWDTTATEIRVARQRSADNSYLLRNGLLAFDTALAAGAEVVACSLEVGITGNVNNEGYSLSWGYHDWDGVSATDLTATPETNAHAGRPLSALTLSTVQTFPLDNVYLINTAGTTKLRATLTGNVPTAINVLHFASLEHPTMAEARLVITYVVVTRTRMAPDGIVSRINLPNVNGVPADDATALAAIDEDPDSPDANWLTV